MSRHLNFEKLGAGLTPAEIPDLYQRTEFRGSDWALILTSFFTSVEEEIQRELERHANAFVSREVSVHDNPLWISPEAHRTLRAIIDEKEVASIAPHVEARLICLVLQHAQLAIEEEMLRQWTVALSPLLARQLLEMFRNGEVLKQDIPCLEQIGFYFVDILRQNYGYSFCGSLLETGLALGWSPQFLAVFDTVLGNESEKVVPFLRFV